MKARVLVAVIGLPALIAVLLFLPVVGSVVLVSLLSAIAAFELLYVTGLVRNPRVIVVTMCMAVFVCSWSYIGMPKLPMQAAAAALMLYYFTELLLANTKQDFTGLCMAMFAALAVPYFLSAIPRILAMDGGRGFVLAPFAMTMIPDSGAFFTGRKRGKHKLAPEISPHKTTEGVVGGVIAGVLGMLLYAFVLHFFGYRVSDWAAALYGLLGAAGSVIGDLVFSTIKRQHNLKDFGNLLPGHGGVLDRFDSTIVVAPMAELLLLLLPFAEKL